MFYHLESTFSNSCPCCLRLWLNARPRVRTKKRGSPGWRTRQGSAGCAMSLSPGGRNTPSESQRSVPVTGVLAIGGSNLRTTLILQLRWSSWSISPRRNSKRFQGTPMGGYRARTALWLTHPPVGHLGFGHCICAHAPSRFSPDFREARRNTALVLKYFRTPGEFLGGKYDFENLAGTRVSRLPHPIQSAKSPLDTYAGRARSSRVISPLTAPRGRPYE